MRPALLAVAGFIAVFVISLVSAPGSHGPPLSRTPYCGPWKRVAHHPNRYVAYANSAKCATALQAAMNYTQTRRCRHRSLCKARIDGFRCQIAGSAGYNLGWIGCYSNADYDPPRVFFSVERR